ncbi:Ribosomal protein S18 acetylase RimI [Metschnikowia aff. pulcherrima]|uniref:Ribosomal protein S18 acetylase RimI n=1 Tax=Metschnikowia aff. pulcherrima TaxID=2163413 RepID=A0A4P6XQA5_9ASCO|nr:Ribosomal protein S18 acetylase RimI [Metschnikowia aff. pulcherrima]
MPYDIEHLKTLPYADRQYATTPKFTENVVFKLAKTGQTVTLLTAHKKEDMPAGLLHLAWQEMNHVIDEGRTYPHYLEFTYDDFLAYFFEGFAAVLIEGELDPKWAGEPQTFWDEKYLGHFYIKPNYIGRCLHVCNAGFVVNHNRRGLGLGKELGKQYLAIAPQLGYVYSVFNLVFETNVASYKIWESLGFERLGYIKNVAMLKGEDKLVGAYMYGKDLN